MCINYDKNSLAGKVTYSLTIRFSAKFVCALTKNAFKVNRINAVWCIIKTKKQQILGIDKKIAGRAFAKFLANNLLEKVCY